ncbi:unnamed protein product [Closterium sp. NIES-53]
MAALMSAMINRVSLCAAFGKVAASATRKEGDTDEKTEMAAQALATSACDVWCFVETNASVLGAVREGKAAAMVAGASEETAKDFTKSQALERVFKEGVGGVEADVIARAMVETLAFWGICPVVRPKLEEIGIAVPWDAQMDYDIEHRGRKEEKLKQGKDSTGRKR